MVEWWLEVGASTFSLAIATHLDHLHLAPLAATLETLFLWPFVSNSNIQKPPFVAPNHLCFGFAWNWYLRQRFPVGKPNPPFPAPWSSPNRHLHHTEAASQQGSDEITRINLTWSSPISYGLSTYHPTPPEIRPYEKPLLKTISFPYTNLLMKPLFPSGVRLGRG